MAQIGSLSVKLGLVTVEWDKATKEAKKQAQDLQKSFDDLSGGVKKLNDTWKMLGGAISVGSIGFAALAQQTIAFTDEITDLAKGFGLTVSQTLAFKDALIGAGANAEQAGKMISSLFTKMDDARQGNDKTVAQFEKLGISFAELKTLSPYDAIQRVAQGFSNVNDQIEKVRLIKDFFGKGGVGLDIDEVSRALDEGSGKYDKYAESIKKVGVINDNIKKSMDNLKIAFANLIAPFTRDSIVSIEKFQAILLSIAAATVVGTVAKLAVQIYEVAAAIRAAAAAGAIFNATAGGFSPAGLLLKGAALVAGVGAYVYSTQTNTPTQPDMPGVGSDIDRHEAAAVAAQKTYVAKQEQLSKEAEAKKSLIGLNNELLKFERQKGALQLEQVTNGGYLLKMQIEDVSLQEKISNINAKRKTDLAANKEGTDALKQQINQLADAEIARAQASTVANKRAIEAAAQYKHMIQQMESNPSFHALEAKDYGAVQGISQQGVIARGEAMTQLSEHIRIADLANKRLGYENSLMDLLPRQRDLLLQQYDLESKLTDFARDQTQLGQDQDWIQRKVQALRKVGDEQIRLNQQTIDHQRTFQYGWNDAYQSYIDNATNAANIARDVFSAVTSNMDSALRNFVRTGKLEFKDLAASIIQDLIYIDLKARATMLWKNAASGNSISGLFGSLFGGASAAASSGGAEDLIAAFAFADGGSPPVGKASLVGERGPELFVPRTAGTIIPNNQIGSMGGTTNVTNNYIQAIDTKSFEDRIYGSANAVWAANRYGEKAISGNLGRA